MTVGVCSDIHDNLDNLATALAHLRERAAVLLCAGDLCAPFSLAALADGFHGPIHVVFGNNDGDQFLLTRVAAQHEHLTIHGHLAQLELAGRKIAMHHYPDVAERLAQSGQYDAVFSGHDHLKYQPRVGACLWANPGEIMGRHGEPSVGVYETETQRFSHIDLESR